MLLKHFKKQPDFHKNIDGIRLLDSLTNSVILIDKDLKLLYMNSACEGLFEVSMDQLLGLTIRTLFKESEDALSKIGQTLVDGGQFTKRRAIWELHNGTRLTVDYTVIPIVENKEIIIEIQSIDRLLQISREEAIIASQGTTRNLVRGLAHEVKNPLGGIRGAAQLLNKELDQVVALSDLKEYTQIIISEADRLRNLVDRMLGPRQLPAFESLNIHEALERVMTVIKAETHGDVALRRNYDPSIPEIQGDIEQLIQALLNISRNAYQALKEQGDSNHAPTIEMSTRVQRQFTIGRQYHNLICCISITDNGPGIPEELVEEIFYPMISGRAEGTGLGLSISQQLIQQHQGLIECKSQPGMTTFSIYLPMDASHVSK